MLRVTSAHLDPARRLSVPTVLRAPTSPEVRDLAIEVRDEARRLDLRVRLLTTALLGALGCAGLLAASNAYLLRRLIALEQAVADVAPGGPPHLRAP